MLEAQTTAEASLQPRAAAPLAARLIHHLESRRAPAILAALVVVLLLPTLRHGFQADDNVFHTLVNDGLHSPTRLFYFPERTIQHDLDVGAFPWWTSSRFTFEFLRPLASVMHWTEFRNFPTAAAGMRLINILLYALTVAVATLAYRELLPRSRAASVAALLFAVDEGHAVVAAWISARNTLLAAFFSVLALLCYLKSYRARGWPMALGLSSVSAICTALALSSAEAGLWALVYVASASLTLELATTKQRLLRLLPQLLVAAGWALVFVQRPYGLRGSGFYRSIAAPGQLLVQGMLDLPLWLVGAFGPGNTDIAASQSPALARLVALPIALLFCACLVPVLTSSRQAKFFALVTLGCIAPLLTTIPQDRLLIGASFGAFGLIGIFIAGAGTQPGSVLTRFGRRLHIGVHACLAPLLFPMTASNPEIMQRTNMALVDAAAGAEDVVLIDSPVETLGYYAQHTLARRLGTLHQLYAGRSELTLTRIDERTLDVYAVLGWGSTPYETFFASDRELPKQGETRRVRGIEISVLATTADGRPNRVRFRFDDQLEAAHRRCLIWNGRQPERFTPPAIGQQKRVAGQPLTAALAL